MNNILVENDNLSFDKGENNLVITKPIVNLTITNEVTINIIKNFAKIEELNITVKKDGVCYLNLFGNKTKGHIKVNVMIEDNATFLANASLVAIAKYVVDITTTMANNCRNIFNLNALAIGGGSYNIGFNGHVLKNTINNQMRECVNILNLNNSQNQVEPNMLIATNEVQADHFVTISNIDPDYLFYLKSKGLEENEAIELFKKGFILDLFVLDENVTNLIKKEEVSYES